MTEHEWDINWRGKFVYCKNTSTCGAIMTFEEVNRRLNEYAELKLAVQAAIEYFTDGITSKEQYDAYLRFVDAAQPFFVVAAQEQASVLRRPYTQLAGTRKPIIGGTEITADEQFANSLSKRTDPLTDDEKRKALLTTEEQEVEP